MFKLGMVRHAGRTLAVMERDGRLIDLGRTALRCANLIDLLAVWPQAMPLLERLAETGGPEVAAAEVTRLAPLLYPGSVFCAGSNYPSHRQEMGPAEPAPQTGQSEAPFFFLKSPRNTIIGDGEAIRIPAIAQRVDWECELGVVIGQRGKNIPLDEAMAYVAGFTVFNDVSARDLNRRADGRFPHDWLSGKCIDSFGPLGPWLVPAAFVPQWRRLRLRLWVDGQLKQDALAGEMIHGVEAQIAYLSSRLTLEPGDLIATGTPAGVGQGRGEFLRPGDEVVAEIETLGRIANPCVAADG